MLLKLEFLLWSNNNRHVPPSSPLPPYSTRARSNQSKCVLGTLSSRHSRSANYIVFGVVLRSAGSIKLKNYVHYNPIGRCIFHSVHFLFGSGDFSRKHIKIIGSSHKHNSAVIWRASISILWLGCYLNCIVLCPAVGDISKSQIAHAHG